MRGGDRTNCPEIMSRFWKLSSDLYLCTSTNTHRYRHTHTSLKGGEIAGVVANSSSSSRSEKKAVAASQWWQLWQQPQQYKATEKYEKAARTRETAETERIQGSGWKKIEPKKRNCRSWLPRDSESCQVFRTTDLRHSRSEENWPLRRALESQYLCLPGHCKACCY